MSNNNDKMPKIGKRDPVNGDDGYCNRPAPRDSGNESLEELIKEKFSKLNKCPHQCECPCHTEGIAIMHVQACCAKCEICNKNIEKDSINDHMTSCHNK